MNQIQSLDLCTLALNRQKQYSVTGSFRRRGALMRGTRSYAFFGTTSNERTRLDTDLVRWVEYY